VSLETVTGTQSIDRAAQLLVRVVESTRSVTVGELAQSTGLPKSTTSRLLAALERNGLLQRENGRGLRPGPVLLRFAQQEIDLVVLAAEALDRLAEASGETINLGVPTPLGVEHLDQRDSAHFVGAGSWVGRRVPHHCAANGKVFLAWGAAPPTEPLEALTPNTIVERDLLERELEAVRERGWAISADELELGLTALAAPVRAGERVVAALSISGPTARIDHERRERLVPLLVEQADAVSRRLGQHDVERGAV
jgi:DNA-binding IclR family transcriptional regulator